ncbi:MAG: NADH-quinone oxidoreductase subunit K, partial [Halochromatium sp.]|uniref:NADH-quinone oxidoreductase subunit K n=1 Tax=Halochromatium sp. TaxID=2049430 RepID=UPI00397D0845
EAAGETAQTIAPMADPLPQALVLTAIVIGFAMTALVLVLILRALSDLGSERVDAQPSDAPSGETQASDSDPGETRPPEAQRDEGAR